MSDDDSRKDDKDNRADEDDDKIIRIPTLAERDRLRKDKQSGNGTNGSGSGNGQDKQSIWRRQYDEQRRSGKQPFLNLPATTKYLAGSLLGVYIIMAFILTSSQERWVIENFAFIPGRFTGELPFTYTTIFTPLSYMWLHGGITHLLLNTVMLVAFGAGIERWFGGKKLVLMMVLSGLCGLLFHMIFYPTSTVPVIGASGGVSGFFAVILVMINKGQWRGGPGNMGGGILPFAVLWIVISLLSAFFSGFGYGTIAWAVHIGGFLGGFLLMRPYLHFR